MQQNIIGAVFTNTNEAGSNHVLAFPRMADGRLGEAVVCDTGGAGSGNGLGAQGALALTEDHRFLLVVNAGSNDVTSFAVEGAKLEVLGRFASGGVRPVSVAVRQDVVYVLNAGDPGAVAGFRLDPKGSLDALDESTRPLGSATAGAAQVAISPDGQKLIVSERTANQLAVYTLDPKGRASDPMVVASAGRVPFGFDVTKNGHVIVSEAGTQSVSSYGLAAAAPLTVISAAVPVTQAAPCWLIVSHDNHVAFVANAGSNSIATFAIDDSGAIRLLNAHAADVGRPLDLGLDRSGRFLYAINRTTMTIDAFAVGAGGELRALGSAGTLPANVSGIAAY